MTRFLPLACALLLAASSSAQTVRIGVLGLFHPRVLLVGSAGASLTMEVGDRSVPLEGRSVRLQLTDRGMQVTAGSGSWNVQRLRVRAGPAGFVLSVPGKLKRTYRGSLEVMPGSGELVPIVSMDQELAVAAIVAVESPPGAPLEALKALAVAVRSFLSARASGHTTFDFCDTTHCQFLRQPAAGGSPAAQAARLTRGMVLTWHDAVFAAMYTPACGGNTRSFSELALPARGYPYFSVECPYCRAHPRPWTRELPRPVRGERDRLGFVRQRGWSALPGNNYGLRERDGVWIAEGSGLGHGLGLCERGAAAMAAEGKSFRDILAHYYPNAGLSSQAAPGY